MIYTLENSMQFKLNEAEFFFGNMREHEQDDDKLYFRYYLSAFVSSLRSVLQYAYEYDSKKYEKLVTNLKYKKYFTGIRNENIHQKPVNVSKVKSIELRSMVVIEPKSIVYTLDEGQLKKMPIEDLIESFEIQKSSEPPDQKDYLIGENQMEYFIDDSLLDICKKYIEEIEKFVQEFSK
ncbi:MAG TPA: hypothetical protein DDY89_04355 [Lysinibacillus sp.]|nr:hypothetical protein [Lysinibacillus sp.]